VTRRIRTGALLAGALLVPAALVSCGGDEEPSAVDRQLAEQCGGRITAGTLDLRVDEGVKTKVNGRWHENGNGQCWVVANDGKDWWEPFSLQVTVGSDAKESETRRRESCADTRDRPDRYLGYTEGKALCSAYWSQKGAYEATGAVGRYYVVMYLPGEPPQGYGNPAEKPRKRFAAVMDDLREYYDT
jgi:hypothetical protein